MNKDLHLFECSRFTKVFMLGLGSSTAYYALGELRDVIRNDKKSIGTV